MALVENIRQEVNNDLSILLTATSDYMVIGGVASNLLPSDAYLTIKPFLINVKVEQGVPFWIQSKTFIPVSGRIEAWATNAPANLIWKLDDDSWNSGNVGNWNSASSEETSVFLDLTIAPI